MWSFSVAHADVELKNDGFVSGGQVAFQGGFVSGESAASRFVAPAAGRQITRVQLLYGGGSTATRTITLKVYDDTGGTNAPGAELYTGDYQLTGSDSAMQEITISDMTVIVPAQFRVGIGFADGCVTPPDNKCGSPSVARDNDLTIDQNKNFIFGVPGGWIKSSTAGLTGDWVIRAFVSDGGVVPPDGAGGPDAGITGGACNGNGECPTGQFCNLDVHACTFECRIDDDCGGGTCNSLGQCVGGSGGGGCCRTDQGNGATGGALLGVGVLGALLVLRRRKTLA